MKLKSIVPILSIFAMLLGFVGCASTGGSPTTQPTPSQIQQDVAAVQTAQQTLDLAELALQVAVVSGAITPAEYADEIQPALNAAQAAITTASTEAQAGDVNGFQIADAAMQAALQSVVALKTQNAPLVRAAIIKAK